MPFEQFLWAIVKTEFLYAGDREYIGENRLFQREKRLRFYWTIGLFWFIMHEIE